MLTQSIHILSFVLIVACITHLIVDIYYEYKKRFPGYNILNDDLEDATINSPKYDNYNSIYIFKKTVVTILKIFIKIINKYYKYTKNYILFIILRIIDIIYMILSSVSKRFVKFISNQYDKELEIKKFDPYLNTIKKESELLEEAEMKNMEQIKQNENIK